MFRHNRSFKILFMKYIYKLCGLKVCIDIPFKVILTEESVDFCEKNDGKDIDLLFQYISVENIEIEEKEGTWENDSFYIKKEKGHIVYHCPVKGMAPYCAVRWDRENPGRVDCFYKKGVEHRIRYTKNLVDLMGLEQLLLLHDGFILHASFVAWRGRGVLFSAPSGTGKSTQASLWEEHMGSTTINGDRAGIRQWDDVWFAHGLPYAGTSGIYKNESVPVEAIIFLEQGAENRICKMTIKDAFKKLLPECSARRWETDFMDHLMMLLLKMIQSVPVYHLQCLPDRQAVELVKNTVFKTE